MSADQSIIQAAQTAESADGSGPCRWLVSRSTLDLSDDDQ